MSTPRVHKPARGTRTGRPIMVALDLLGRRWTLRVLWELREEALGFRALQARCEDLSPTMLSRRLTELRESRIVETSTEGVNSLTPIGRKLIVALAPLHAWSESWAKTQ